jgi:uncharacterized protein (TIGR02246 family)
VIDGLTRAWNHGDAAALASFFTEDADLVNIQGMHLHGRQSIAGIYDALFRSVFSSSSVKSTISSLRLLRKDVALVHLKIVMHLPGGFMEGVHDMVSSLVLTREACQWMVVSLHNTVVAPSRG